MRWELAISRYMVKVVNLCLKCWGNNVQVVVFSSFNGSISWLYYQPESASGIKGFATSDGSVAIIAHEQQQQQQQQQPRYPNMNITLLDNSGKKCGVFQITFCSILPMYHVSKCGCFASSCICMNISLLVAFV
jgi:hypothetical protein